MVQPMNFPQSLRVIPYQCFHGAENMALDYFLTHFAAEQNQPVLRFYGWEPACLSLGRHQNADLVDSQKLNEIDFVRRPTGGSAIFHSNELTYSFILPAKMLGHHEMYTYFHRILAQALNKLGFPVKLQKSQLSDAYINKGNDTFSCFNRAARSEIKYQGKKVVGSAQKIYKHAILQHGSIMLGKNHLKIVDFLRLDDDEKIQQKKILEDHAMDLSAIGKPVPTIATISETLLNTFEQNGVSKIYYQYINDPEWRKSRTYLDRFRINR